MRQQAGRCGGGGGGDGERYSDRCIFIPIFSPSPASVIFVSCVCFYSVVRVYFRVVWRPCGFGGRANISGFKVGSNCDDQS